MGEFVIMGAEWQISDFIPESGTLIHPMVCLFSLHTHAFLCGMPHNVFPAGRLLHFLTADTRSASLPIVNAPRYTACCLRDISDVSPVQELVRRIPHCAPDEFSHFGGVLIVFVDIGSILLKKRGEGYSRSLSFVPSRLMERNWSSRLFSSFYPVLVQDSGILLPHPYGSIAVVACRRGIPRRRAQRRRVHLRL